VTRRNKGKKPCGENQLHRMTFIQTYTQLAVLGIACRQQIWKRKRKKGKRTA